MRDGLRPTCATTTTTIRDGVETNSWKEECGVFAVFGHTDAAELTHTAMIALQHRGQEAAGIASVDGANLYHERGLGLVTEAMTPAGLERLAAGHAAVGHVRYSTTGANELPNAQPLVFAFRGGNVALAHNGNLVSAHLMKRRLETAGTIFQTTSDTEVVAHMIARDQSGDMAAKLGRALGRIVGAYAFCLLTDERLYAVRDPHGLRPMVLGVVDGAWCVASESCALDAIGAELVRDVEPGELLSIGYDGVESHRPFPPAKRALCTFEHIYFARADSDIDGHNVHVARRRFGELLAQESPAQADVVIGVPDSSISAAIGFAAASGLPYEIGLVKNRYVGRSFILPSQALRRRGVNRKLAVVRRVVEGQRVVMIDDSLVRGTTSRRIVELLRGAGAREVHVRIASPPVAHSCYYGIDTSARDELVASDHSVEQIRALIGADSLEFLSEPALLRAFDADPGSDDHGFCNACFTGRYPTPVETGATKESMGTRGAREVVTP